MRLTTCCHLNISKGISTNRVSSRQHLNSTLFLNLLGREMFIDNFGLVTTEQYQRERLQRYEIGTLRLEDSYHPPLSFHPNLPYRSRLRLIFHSTHAYPLPKFPTPGSTFLIPRTRPPRSLSYFHPNSIGLEISHFPW